MRVDFVLPKRVGPINSGFWYLDIGHSLLDIGISFKFFLEKMSNVQQGMSNVQVARVELIDPTQTGSPKSKFIPNTDYRAERSAICDVGL